MDDRTSEQHDPPGIEITSAPAPWSQPPAETHESHRLKALLSTGLLDSERELEFDQLIELAASICGTPMSTFTLIDADRAWFKASVGVDVRETTREVSFCSHAIEQPDLLVVEDATEDPRFSDHPWVTGAPAIRFYAGMPLAGPDGYMLGTLCVADTVPRHLSPSQKTALQILAAQLKARVELRSQGRRLEEALKVKEDLLLALQSSHNRFTTFMENCPFLSFMKDQDGRFVFYNKRVAQQFGVDSKAWIGKTMTEIWPGELGESIRKNDLEAMETDETIESEEETREANGNLSFWRSYKFSFLNEKGQRLLGGFSINITEEIGRRRALENANAKLERLATVDPLTGLGNRRLLDERLEQEFQFAKRYRTPLSVILLDIDNFKLRNDQLGHRSGDEVLRMLGQVLKSTIRATDLAGRYGGEEFLILLPSTDAEGAMLSAQRIYRALRAEDWPHRPVTASFGISSLDRTTPNSRRMVDRADDAMYEAKRLGKDQIVAHQDFIRAKLDELRRSEVKAGPVT